MMSLKKVTIVVNKNWETEPVVNAIVNSEIRPKELPFPMWLNSPHDGSYRMNAPRLSLKLDNGQSDSLQVNLWCLQDLMNPLKSSSSSEEKYNVLPKILKVENPDLVIAVGTAGHPSDVSKNGSVTIGANFFIHDGHPDNPASNLKHDMVGQLIASNLNPKFFDIFSQDFKNVVESKFIATPKNPALKAECYASANFASLGNINVTDYKEYPTVDPEGVKHFNEVVKNLELSSIETTHGIIKLSSDAPTIFISAITDRLGHFDTEVTPTQNYAASFNAGIVIGQLICSLNSLVISNFSFKLDA